MRHNILLLIVLTLILSIILTISIAFADSVDEWNQMGIEFYGKGKYQDAIDCFDKAIKLNPKSAQIWYNMSMAYYKIGNKDKGKQCLSKVKELDPTFITNLLAEADKWIKKGDLAVLNKNYDEAISCYDKAIEVAIKQEDKKKAQDKKKEVELAMQKQKDELVKTQAQDYLTKGNDFLKQKQYEEAIKCYDEALKILPSSTEATNKKKEAELALQEQNKQMVSELTAQAKDLYYKKGDASGALEAYNKVLKLVPGNEEATKGKEKIENDLALAKKYNLVLIPGGTFQMGSNSGEENEKPVHPVEVSPFYMGKYEVTHKDYCIFLNENKNQEEGGELWIDMNSWRGTFSFINNDKGSFNVEPGYENCPVMSLSWFGSVGYCNWLSQKEGLNKCYGDINNRGNGDITKNGFRLPTEAEWEYACRAGSAGKYFWGDTMNNSYCYNTFSKWGGLGQLMNYPYPEANEFGLCNMSGGVWEWISDWYGPYSNTSQTNPTGPENGKEKVARGGGFGSSDETCTSSHREGNHTTHKFQDHGFRIVKGITY